MSGATASRLWEYQGVRALVILHDHELRRFLDTWRRAASLRLSLAATQYPQGTTLDDVLCHVLCRARDYLAASCEQLGLPDPGCRPSPEAHAVASTVDEYLEHLLDCWYLSFRGVPEEAFREHADVKRWGSPSGVEALMEHALVHPMRHRLQLQDLMLALGKARSMPRSETNDS